MSQKTLLQNLALICLLFGQIVYIINAETKLLYELSPENHGPPFLHETASLKNADTDAPELVVEGSYTLYFKIKNNNKDQYIFSTVYKADKNGYQGKYKITKVASKFRLSVNALKSAAG